MEENLSFFNYVREKSRRSSIIFNVEPKTKDIDHTQTPNKKAKTEYQQQLQKEISEWYQLISNGKDELKKLQENNGKQSLTIDVLNDEQKMFYLDAPNFNDFTKDSIDFINEAKTFLKLTEDHFKRILYLEKALADKLDNESRDIIITETIL